MNRPVPQWLRRAANMAASLALLALVTLFLGVTVVPRVFGAELRTIRSGSMEPAIGRGSLAVALPVSAGDIRAGDVIMFRQPGDPDRIITHRAADVLKEGESRTIQTRGDANTVLDPWSVAPANVIGRVQFHIPMVGVAIDKIRTREGFVLLMVIPALLLLLGELPLWRRLVLGVRRGHPSPASGDQPPARADRSAVAGARGIATFPLLVFSTAIVAAAVTAIAAVAYFSAPRPSSTATEARLAAEARSVAAHSGTLANGDAFSGDIQILRYADDPAIRAADAPTERRLAALQQMLYLNTNTLDSLSIVDLSGGLVATTDPSITEVRANAAFLLARANDGPAASDITPAAEGGSFFVDFAAPIRGDDGVTTSILIGRADPARLWARTLATTIDGGRNIILKNDGTLVAGAQTHTLQPFWSAVRAHEDTLAAAVDGAASVCAIRNIGTGTHLDHGWSVASCLPATLGATADSGSYREFGAAILSAAAITVILSAAVMYVAFRERRPARPRAAKPTGYEAIEARIRAQREGSFR